MDRRFVWAAAVIMVLAAVLIALSLPYKPCAGAFTDTCRPPEEAVTGYTRFEPNWSVRWAVIGGGVVLALLLLGATSRRPTDPWGRAEWWDERRRSEQAEGA